MNRLVTFIIPYTKAHEHLVDKAITSAANQTVKSMYIEACDKQGKGAGYVRNWLVSKVETPFICCLDADDTVHETFTEECLKAYRNSSYVYTSWYCGAIERKPKLCVERGQEDDYRSHLVTTLYPTVVFRAVGGFDENLPGHEDVDFYLRSQQAGICGIYLDKPLVNYTEHGQRSNLFNQRPDKKAIMDDVYLRNGGQSTIMACCGAPGEVQKLTIGVAQPGDVTAQTLWGGMRSEVGPVTGRVYRGGNGSEVPVSPADLAVMPHLLREVKDVSKLAPDREQVLREAGLV